MSPEMKDLLRLRLATLLSSVKSAPSMFGTTIYAPDGWLCVSTVVSYDMGMETAILDGTIGVPERMGTFPVERYKTKEEAEAGHKKWVEFIKQGNRDITKLGYGVSVKEQPIKLVPSTRNEWKCSEVEIV